MLTFKGFQRADGQVGVRNHVAILPLTAALNGIVTEVVKRVPELISFAHTSSYFQETSPYHDRLIRSLLLHPNYGAIILVGLGYEKDDAKMLAQEYAQKQGSQSLARL